MLRLILCLLACTLTASAHEVWIEDTPEGGLVVRFAEYGDPFEKSPGNLDSLMLPFAWQPAGAPAEEKASMPDPATAGAPGGERKAILAGKVNAFEVQKKDDGFWLLQAQAAQPAQIETGFTVMGTPGNPEKPARKPYFYARWQPPGAGAARPGLNLDLVPTGKAGEACLCFRGQPLAGYKVTFHPPGEADQELTTDAAGRVSYPVAKPGLYLLSAARYREALPGFYGGKPYDVASHSCSLAWRQP